MDTERRHTLGATTFQHLGSLDQRGAGVDKVVDNDAVFARDVADKFAWSRLVDVVLADNKRNRHGFVNASRQDVTEEHRTVHGRRVRSDHNRIREVHFGKVHRANGERLQIVHLSVNRDSDQSFG